MENKYSGYLNDGRSIFVNQNPIVENPVVSRFEQPRREDSSKKIILIIFLLSLIGGIYYFLYLAQDNKFQSTNSMNVNPLFNASVTSDFNVTSNTNNDFKVNSTTLNTFNYTIVNNIYCNKT